jgi:hypothetical protein
MDESRVAVASTDASWRFAHWVAGRCAQSGVRPWVKIEFVVVTRMIKLSTPPLGDAGGQETPTGGAGGEKPTGVFARL